MKRIKLTQGRYAIVDDGDYEWLSQFQWYFHQGYARRDVKNSKTGKTKTVFLHRVVNNTPDGMDTDHINQNKLDNRKENLRSCTMSQNLSNRTKQKNNTSGYKGVTWHKLGGKWQAQIRIKSKFKYLGYFSNIHDAVQAYNIAAQDKFGEFAFINKVSH